MRIAAIEQGNRQYLLDVFARHPEFEGGIALFAEQKPKADRYKDIPVIPLSELKEAQFDAVLIAVKLNHHVSRLLVYLHDAGISNIYVIRLLAMETQAEFIIDGQFDTSCVDKIPGNDEKPYLVHLETHVCDHCNLNCKACEHFSPFVKERVVTELSEFEAEMKHISRLYSNIGRFNVLGGEPLLEPERCCEMIKVYRSYFPDSEVRLLTNAILIHKMDPGFWQCLRENNVIVQISLYPPMFDRLEEVERVLQENHITYLLAGRLKRTEKFLRRMTRYPFEDEEINNSLCRSAGCFHLQKGTISKCPDSVLVAYMAPALGCSREELQTRESIDLADAEDGWDVIRRLNGPADMCKKCALQRAEQFDWEVAGASPDPKDWLLENRLEYENRKLNETIADMTDKKKSVEAELLKMTATARQREAELEEQKRKQKAAEEELGKQIRDKEKDLQLKNKEILGLQRQAEELQTQVSQTRKQLLDREKTCRDLHNELDAVHASISFRLGRTLTWGPRKVRDRMHSTKNEQR